MATSALLAVSCIEGPTGPGSQQPSTVSVVLALPPATPPIWFPTGETLRVAVRRAGRAEPIADTALIIGDSLAARLTIPMSQSLESFVATLEVLYSGSLYFLAFEALRIHAGTDTAVTLAATYVGPGARAATYALGVGDSSLRRGDTTSLVPVVLDSAGQQITNVPARYLSYRPGIVSVAPTGVLTAQPVPPDTARIAGYLPSGLHDSLLVRVRSRADSAALVSGGGQTGKRLRPLPQAITVVVLDDQGQPLEDEAVQFTANPGNGSFAPAVAVTDSIGRAAAIWTLGAPVGPQQATVIIDGVQPLTVAALAEALPVQSVVVAPASATLTTLGATQQFTATALDSTATTLAGQTFTWSSSDMGVATVDATGLATAVSNGGATITAATAGVSGTASLTVSTSGVYADEEIAFISTRDGNREVYVMQSDGSGARRITNTPEDEYRPGWAPDRAALVFERDIAGGRQIVRAAADGSGETQLTFSGDNTRPRYSPDGTRIAFSSDRAGAMEVWVMAADGGNQHRLVDASGLSPDGSAQYALGDYFGDWAPEGTRIAFVRYDCPEGCWPELRITDTAGSDIASPGIYGSQPSVPHAVRWSPQGWRIAMTSDLSGSDTSLTTAHTGHPIGVMPDHSAAFDANAAFAGAWDQFVFESEDAGVHGIYSGSYDAAGNRLSPAGVAEFEPDYVPPAAPSYLTSVAVAGDVATPINPGETRQLNGAAYDQNGAPVTAENGFQWYVNGVYPDYLVAQVDSTGLVTGKAGGAARIVMRYTDAATDSTSVTVVHAPGTWAPGGLMTQARFGHAGLLLGDGRVLVTGGIVGYSGGAIVTSGTELYDPATGTSVASGGMRASRYEHTMTRLLDGRVLIVAGRYGDFVRTVQRTAELYDPVTGTTAFTDSLGKSDPVCCTGRRYHTATLLTDGRVLVAGGGGATSGNASYSLRQSELYDPTAGTFTSTGLMTVPRQQHTATLLPNGTVLITGGMGASLQDGTAGAEIYDPTSGAFSATNSMAVGRREHAAVALADGRILVTGGYDYFGDRSIAAAEIYDPATGLFSTTGDMTIGRRGHTATLLANGKVLIAGGMYNSGGFFYAANSAELYDPASGTFAPTGAMSESRTYQTAILLPSGLVAVSGSTGGTLSALIELYKP